LESQLRSMDNYPDTGGQRIIAIPEG